MADTLDPTARGDPESPLRWTCKSLQEWNYTILPRASP